MSESPPTSEPCCDSGVTDSTEIVDELSESAPDNVQMMGEFRPKDEVGVQHDTKLTVNSNDDCIRKKVESPFHEAFPFAKIFSPSQDLITTHSFPNEDFTISESQHADAIKDEAMTN
ncbi:hypothetical protein P8452_14520 [Trifolium repens]|nr:hypothetical protein P8452_14520 [Trifolium repens]